MIRAYAKKPCKFFYLLSAAGFPAEINGGFGYDNKDDGDYFAGVGIVGLVGGALTSIPVLGYIIPFCPIAGIVFGALALNKIKNEGAIANEKGMAIAGLVLGIVAFVLDILLLCLCGAALALVGATAGAMQ